MRSTQTLWVNQVQATQTSWLCPNPLTLTTAKICQKMMKFDEMMLAKEKSAGD